MRKLMVVAAAAWMSSTAWAADPATERGAEPAPYWGVHLGQNTLKDWDARIDFGSGEPFAGRADLERGWHGGFMVGRRTAHARFELEYQQGSIEIERLTLQGLSAQSDGRGRYQAVFGNAYRAERINDSLGAFVGGGIGWGRVKLPYLGLGTTCACFGPAAKSGFAWQVRAGLDYALSPQGSITLQYSLLNLPEPTSGGTPGIEYEQRRVGAISLGYLRRF